MNKVIIFIIFVVSLVTVLFFYRKDKEGGIDSFESCVKAGFPVAESYPRQCRAGGKTFIEEIGDILEPQKVTEEINNKPFSLPPGFVISKYITSLVNPRDMIFDNRGNMIVSLTSAGKVIAIKDSDNNGQGGGTIELVNKLRNPHGLALNCIAGKCDLYIAEENQVVSFSYDEDNPRLSARRKILDLPAGGGHFTRSLLFVKKDGETKLLVSVGSSCNVCEEKDTRRSSVLITNLDGTNVRTYAKGLRNAVFMSLNPEDENVWVTEMGRDYLGDNLPPDEVNILVEGADYGWPYCYGGAVRDKTFLYPNIPDGRCSLTTKAVINIQAHSAPLGLVFVPKNNWPQEYWGNLLISYHGSWNRSVPTGYKVVRVNKTANSYQENDFITGFLSGGKVSGRPADLEFNQKGDLFITDDKEGVIYKVSYRGS